MPTEVIIPGLRDVGNGPSEESHQKLQEMREQGIIQVWALAGSAEECEQAWREFMLEGVEDGVLYAPPVE